MSKKKKNEESRRREIEDKENMMIKEIEILNMQKTEC